MKLDRDEQRELLRLAAAWSSASWRHGRDDSDDTRRAQTLAYREFTDYLQGLGDGSGFFRSGVF